MNNQDFLEKCYNIHKGRYKYKSEYKNGTSKILIECSKHGEFEQLGVVHLRGAGCKKCSYERNAKQFKLNFDEIIDRFNIKHNYKYDYSLVIYKNNRTKIDIICPEHGIFKQEPRSHELSGCPNCDKSKKSSTKEYIEKIQKIHGNLYSYENVNYVNAITKIEVGCRIHGIFNITPNNHLNGKGCPKCKYSKGEKTIVNFLNCNKIQYIKDKSFDDCIYKRKLKFDFYLIEKNTIIEFDGEQHFRKFRFEKDDSKLKERIHRDEIKNNYCSLKNIKLIRIRYNENIFEILTSNLD